MFEKKLTNMYTFTLAKYKALNELVLEIQVVQKYSGAVKNFRIFFSTRPFDS